MTAHSSGESLHSILYVDGASFGNPGPSGIGCVLVVDGTTVAVISADAGWGTNNRAEYTALHRGLGLAREHGARELLVRSDSLLLVKQMNGEYKVKDKGLKLMKAEADGLVESFDRVRFEYVPRERNDRADTLAKAGAEEAKLRGVRPAQRELLE